MNITYLHPHGPDLIGLIPTFLLDSDPRPASEQFNERYAFGGGWRPMDGWSHYPNIEARLNIQYPDDPVYTPVARITLRDETIWVYRHAWVAIEKADGSVEISRMD